MIETSPSDRNAVTLRLTVVTLDRGEVEFTEMFPEDYLNSMFDRVFDRCKEELRRELKRKAEKGEGA